MIDIEAEEVLRRHYGDAWGPQFIDHLRRLSAVLPDISAESAR